MTVYGVCYSCIYLNHSVDIMTVYGVCYSYIYLNHSVDIMTVTSVCYSYIYLNHSIYGIGRYYDSIWCVLLLYLPQSLYIRYWQIL